MAASWPPVVIGQRNRGEMAARGEEAFSGKAASKSSSNCRFVNTRKPGSESNLFTCLRECSILC